MKLLLACSSYPPHIKGGGEISTQKLAEALAGIGIDVTVLTVAERAGAARVNGIDVVQLAPANIYWSVDAARKPKAAKAIWHAIDSANLAMARHVRKVIRDVRPDAFHTSTIEDLSPYVWAVAKAEGLPVLHTLRSYTLMCPSATMYRDGGNCVRQCTACRMATLPKRILSRRVDTVIGISRFVLDAHARAGYFPLARGEVVRSVFDAPPAAGPRRAGPPPVRFGFIGRLHPIKGVEPLLAAFRAASVRERAELAIAGRGAPEYEAGLKRLARDLPADFLGHVTPEEFFPSVDVVVVPSVWHEPLGRVVFEAYAHGKPVIGARRGGIAEIVDEGSTGFLFDPDDQAELASVLRRLVDRPELIGQMEAACRRKADDFSSARIAQAHLELYAAACAGPLAERLRVVPPS